MNAESDDYKLGFARGWADAREAAAKIAEREIWGEPCSEDSSGCSHDSALESCARTIRAMEASCQ